MFKKKMDCDRYNFFSHCIKNNVNFLLSINFELENSCLWKNKKESWYNEKDQKGDNKIKSLTE